MKDPNSTQQPWQLSSADFYQPALHVKPNWRYQAFFRYLRISPSYRLAFLCESQEQLAEVLGCSERAALVWQTKQDMGDVHAGLYKTWWQQYGLKAFGVHSERPVLTPLAYLPTTFNEDKVKKNARSRLSRFMDDRYLKQGRPDSVLISVPMTQPINLSVKQLRIVLTKLKDAYPVHAPTTQYTLVKNKMRKDRLASGRQLVVQRAKKPDDELWRVAVRAKISQNHANLDADAPKKRSVDAHARRMLTIMASRLYRETLIIAENAAIGKFPSLDPIEVMPFDLNELYELLRATFEREKEIKARMKLEAEALKAEAKEESADPPQ